MRKKIIIIGAGIAGLSAGCYGLMNGYDTVIYEMHDKPGGCCTAWERSGFTFDGCLQWVEINKPGNPAHSAWEELGVIPNSKFANSDELIRIIYGENNQLIAYSDIDRFEKELLEISSQDYLIIKEFTNAVRAGLNHRNNIDEKKMMVSFIRRAKSLANMNGGLMSIEEFSKRFKNDFLRKAFPLILSPSAAMLVLIDTFSLLSGKLTGVPLGGSLEFAKTIEKKYLELGGKISYNSKISKILHSNSKAIGIRLENGKEDIGDAVISAADGHQTIYEMLDGTYLNENINQVYKSCKAFKPLVQVSLGINIDLSDEPRRVLKYYDQPIFPDTTENDSITIMNYSYDKTLAPENKTCLVALLSTDYEFWKEAYKDMKRYNDLKEQLGQKIVKEVECVYPQIRNKIEEIDIATPITWENYTGNWKASFEGWIPTAENIQKKINNTLPGLADFYMAGHWIKVGGGVVQSALSGREVIQEICSKDNKKFVKNITEAI